MKRAKFIKRSYIWIFLVFVLLFAAAYYARMPKGVAMNDQSQPIPKEESDVIGASERSTPPKMQIDVKKKYTATLQTAEGNIVIALTAKETPRTVNNFVSLSRKGFYDNTVFHRVIKGFMIQGGDPRGNGTGGPGYAFADEPFTGSYVRGVVAMANSGPNTNGSQFFIMHADYELPHDYVIFGQVTQGMETVDKIATAETIRDNRENSKPVNPVTVESVSISETN